jgi:predicted ABC-type ATPase
MKNQSPWSIYAVAGAPASGKTSFVQRGLKEGLFPAEAFLHDCDAVMSEFEGYQADLKKFGPADAFKNWELAAREAAQNQLERAVEGKNDIIYDRSCALLSCYHFLENAVKKQGYKLILHGLHINLDQALARAAERERQTRRHIPLELIQERLKMFSVLWPSYLALSEKAYLYDTNGNNPCLIARFICNKLEINDNISYQNFIAQGENV